MTKVFRGSSFPLKLTIKDQDSQPIDLTGKSALVIAKSLNSQPFGEWRYPAPLVGKPIKVIDAAEGEYLIQFDKSDTLKADPGEFNIEIKIKQTDGDYEDSSYFTIAEIEVGEILDAVTAEANVDS